MMVLCSLTDARSAEIRLTSLLDTEESLIPQMRALADIRCNWGSCRLRQLAMHALTTTLLLEISPRYGAKVIFPST